MGEVERPTASVMHHAVSELVREAIDKTKMYTSDCFEMDIIASQYALKILQLVEQ